MIRYTTKHFWRMKESEQGEWIRYDEHEEEVEWLRSNCALYREAKKDMYLKYKKEYRLSNHLTDRVNVLLFVLIVNLIVFVAQLIGWSLGL